LTKLCYVTAVLYPQCYVIHLTHISPHGMHSKSEHVCRLLVYLLLISSIQMVICTGKA